MSNGRDDKEPSMEEILSSIRRIIADEHDGDEDRRRTTRDSTAEGEQQPKEGDVSDELELTDVVSEQDQSRRTDEGGETAAARPGGQRSSVELVREGTGDRGTGEREAVTERSGDDVLSEETAAASTGAFARLARAATRDERAPVSGGDKTIEEFLHDMMRPMLREWLDQNLPTLVERVVEQEVKKLARRAELM